MKSPVLISIVIINYNVKEYLEQALISIKKALTNFQYEIIVVDNASVDGSVPYISQRFPEIKLIPLEENIGFGRANNIAFKQLKNYTLGALERRRTIYFIGNGSNASVANDASASLTKNTGIYTETS